MDFRVLGALEVEDDSRDVHLGGAKERGLLALLLLHANEFVSRDFLIEGLWGEEAPESARHSLEAHLSRLRKALGSGARIEGRSGGYLFHLDPSRLDLHGFERLLEEGQAALAQGVPEHAETVLTGALRLWRGAPLADLDEAPFALVEIARLKELRLTAQEAKIEADLHLGRHAEIVADLEALLALHPLRERLRAQLMLALYRSGRQADALDVYLEGRTRLVDELGIEPGRELQQLQKAILEHHPSLELPQRPVARLRDAAPVEFAAIRRSRWRRRAIAIASSAALAALALTFATRQGEHANPEPIVLQPGTVGVIDARTNEIVGRVQAGRSPAALAAGLGDVWIFNTGDNAVVRIAPEEQAVVATIPLARADERVVLEGLATGYGAVWVTCLSNGHLELDRISTALDSIAATLVLGPASADASAPVAIGAGAVWVADSGGRILRVDPRTTRQVGALGSGLQATALAVADNALWVASWNTLTPVYPRSRARGSQTRLGTFARPRAIATGENGVWVTLEEDDAIARIDPLTGSMTRIPTGDGPVDVAVGDGAVWVANRLGRSISRVDPTAMKVVATIQLDANPIALAVEQNDVWVALGRPPTTRIAPSGKPQHALATLPRS